LVCCLIPFHGNYLFPFKRRAEVENLHRLLVFCCSPPVGAPPRGPPFPGFPQKTKACFLEICFGPTSNNGPFFSFSQIVVGGLGKFSILVRFPLSFRIFLFVGSFPHSKKAVSLGRSFVFSRQTHRGRKRSRGFFPRVSPLPSVLEPFKIFFFSPSTRLRTGLEPGP